MTLAATYDFEEGADGDPILAGANGVVNTFGSPVYSSELPAHGGLSFFAAAESPTARLDYDAPNNAAWSASIYVTPDTTPSSGAGNVMGVANAPGNHLIAIRMHSDGFFDMGDYSGEGFPSRLAKSDAYWSTGGTHRVDIQVAHDGSTLTVTARIFITAESAVYDSEITGSIATDLAPDRVWVTTGRSTWAAHYDTLRLYDFLQWADPIDPLPAGNVLHSWLGAPVQDGFQVVSKLDSGSAVRLVVSESSNMDNPTYFGPEAIDSSGYVRHETSGLDAGTRYYYQLEDAGTPIGTVGKARTLPRSGSIVSSFRVALGACTLKNRADGGAHTDVRVWDPDFFVHTGDFYYTSSTTTNPDFFEGLYADMIQTYPGHSELARDVPFYYCASDHEAGPDNGDSDNAWTVAHIAAYKRVAPHRLVDKAANPRGRWQTWTVGRIRFIMLDIRNLDRSPGLQVDTSSKTMLGATQKAWLKAQLLQPEALKVIISDVGWMGPASTSNGEDKWWSYDSERSEIATFINVNGVNVDLWHGDSHALAAATGSSNSWGGFPVLCAAPLAQSGGGRNLSEFDSYYNNNGAESRQYMRITFEDDGEIITRTASGWDADFATERISSVESWDSKFVGQVAVTVWNGTEEERAYIAGVWDGSNLNVGGATLAP